MRATFLLRNYWYLSTKAFNKRFSGCKPDACCFWREILTSVRSYYFIFFAFSLYLKQFFLRFLANTNSRIFDYSYYSTYFKTFCTSWVTEKGFLLNCIYDLFIEIDTNCDSTIYSIVFNSIANYLIQNLIINFPVSVKRLLRHLTLTNADMQVFTLNLLAKLNHKFLDVVFYTLSSFWNFLKI